MSILNSVLKVFVGDKQKKDLKILQPIVYDVKKFESALKQKLLILTDKKIFTQK